MAPRRTRFYFADFTLSPGHRQLMRGGREIPLIPRYLDLLLLLVARRHEAVHRTEILDVVWRDVVVSDGALTQAIRALRRALDDDTREPVYIRTVARHGYQFIHPDVREAEDGAPIAPAPPSISPPTNGSREDEEATLESELGKLLAPGSFDTEERREAAERLHALGTDRTLAKLGSRGGHPAARALLRDTRWAVGGAGAVPILGAPSPLKTALLVAFLRASRATRIAKGRWISAIKGAALSGVFAGGLGGLALCLGPGSTAASYVPLLLALIGALWGALGAAGVAAGLCAADSLTRSWRRLLLVAFGGVGGGLVGVGAHLLAGWMMRGLFGRDLEPIAGGFEGLVLGSATGLGYAIATPEGSDGLPAPRGLSRLSTAALAGVLTGAAGVLLGASGRHLGALSLDLMARSFPGSQVGLGPLARLLGEREAGPATTMAISAWEGLLFAGGTVHGLTQRPATPEPPLAQAS